MSAQKYYTLSDKLDFEYCLTPKALFESEKLKKLSDSAKLLYVAILSRLTLSIKNGWKDEEGRVYVYYSLEDVCEKLGCSLSKAVRLFKEIDNSKGIGLIERKRLGLGKTSIIYVLKQEYETEEISETHDPDKENTPCLQSDDDAKALPCEDVFFDEKSELNSYGDSDEVISGVQNDKSELIKSKNHNLSESASNKNKYNNNKLNNNYFNNNNINQSINSGNNIKPTNNSYSSDGWSERISEYKKIIKNNISYETLVSWIRKEWLDEIVDIMADVICSKSFEKINNVIYPPDAIKERLLSLRSDHIEYVWECLKTLNSPISNVRAYMLTSLYRAPETMINWYKAQVASNALL